MNTAEHSPAVAKAMARFWNKMAEVRLAKDAVQQERGQLAYLFEMQAIDHENAARESERNDEPDDAEHHEIEAIVWREARSMVINRDRPPAAESAEIPEPDIAF